MSDEPKVLPMTMTVNSLEIPMTISEAIIHRESEPIPGSTPGTDVIWNAYITRTLESVNSSMIPNEMTELFEYLFQYNSELYSVSLTNVTSVGAYCFYHCGIEELNLPNLVSAGTRAFSENPIYDVWLPNLITLSSQVFQDCKNLSSATFDSVQSIGARAFYGCTNLSDLTLKANSVVMLSAVNALEGTAIASSSGHIYVPESVLYLYQLSESWSEYVTRFLPIQEA